MSDEEELPEEPAPEEEEAEAASRKGPAKCFGGTPKRGSLIRVGWACRTSGTARPTAIFQCMSTQRKDLCQHPQAAPKSGPGVPSLPQNPTDCRGQDNYPPQGGTLLKTCGVKAQFTGEIVIKKDIPPRPPQCTGSPQCQLNQPNLGCIPSFEEPVKVRPCPPSPQHHHQAPICCIPMYPCQPEISEECRRVLRCRGPDSSRFHPECPCFCAQPLDCCGCDDDCCGCGCCYPECGACGTCGTCDFDSPERLLHPGEEERFETVRTREEIMLDPDDQCCHTYQLCADDCAKYVRTEDTFRRTRCYNPPAECFPPPVCCSMPMTGCLRQCQECPPRCPGSWEGPPCQEDLLCHPAWKSTLDAEPYEAPKCKPPCYNDPMQPMTESQNLNTPVYEYNATKPC